VNRFKRSEWDVAYGASGTLHAVADALRAHDPAATSIDRAGLEWLLQETLRAGQTSRLKLPGLSPERQDVLPGGLAILLEVFDALGIETMRVAEGALPEGLRYDLPGPLHDEDARLPRGRAPERREQCTPFSTPCWLPPRKLRPRRDRPEVRIPSGE